MSLYFNAKESQPSAEREQALLARLAPFISYAKKQCAYYAQSLKDIDASSVNSRAELARLPIIRKSALIELQQNNAPFAGLNARMGVVNRIFQSPGPINDPEVCSDDWWRLGQAFFAAGFRGGDKVQNCLSYHLTPGGFILDSGARACGCIVIPAGPGQSAQQLDVIENLKPQGYCGTPSFLKILLDKAKADNRDISSIKKALVTGEAYLPPLRAEFKAAGISALQAYASADVGLIGYESEPHDGLIIAEDIIVEIVRPGTNELVPEGEVGEVVVTSFNQDYPLIRFATGDLSALLPGMSECGRTNMRIKGWMGRADQTTKVKGMFVHPEQIEKIRQKHPQVSKARLAVTQVNLNDHMSLLCEADISAMTDDQYQNLCADIQLNIKNITRLNASVQLVATNSLPNDGKVIDDQRSMP